MEDDDKVHSVFPFSELWNQLVVVSIYHVFLEEFWYNSKGVIR